MRLLDPTVTYMQVTRHVTNCSHECTCAGGGQVSSRIDACMAEAFRHSACKKASLLCARETCEAERAGQPARAREPGHGTSSLEGCRPVPNPNIGPAAHLPVTTAQLVQRYPTDNRSLSLQPRSPADVLCKRRLLALHLHPLTPPVCVFCCIAASQRLPAFLPPASLTLTPRPAVSTSHMQPG